MYRRLSTIHPSTVVIAAVFVACAIFIFSGGVWTVINAPPPAVYYNSEFYFLYPSLTSQFISDTVISAVLYLLGFVGLLAIYQSTKNAYNPRQAYMLLAIGISLLVVAYIALEGSIAFKISG